MPLRQLRIENLWLKSFSLILAVLIWLAIRPSPTLDW